MHDEQHDEDSEADPAAPDMGKRGHLEFDAGVDNGGASVHKEEDKGCARHAQEEGAMLCVGTHTTVSMPESCAQTFAKHKRTQAQSCSRQTPANATWAIGAPFLTSAGRCSSSQFKHLAKAVAESVTKVFSQTVCVYLI